jgi:hypothetical protein
MTTEVQFRYSRTFPADVEPAFDKVLPYDLTKLFDRRYAAIPPIRSVRDQIGAWGTPGQARTIVLSDGGTMREELLEVSRPDRFGYRITGITGPMKPMVASLDGVWAFEPAGTGVRITWSWSVQPAGRLGSLAMPLFRRMWLGYARKGFDNIEQLLLR